MSGEQFLPDRVAMRPGVEVLRRDGASLQFGLGPDRLVLRDTEALRRLLVTLAGGRAQPGHDPEVRRCAQALLQHGVLVDADSLGADLSRRPELAATAYAQESVTASRRLRRRADARVGVDASGEWEAEVGRLLDLGGLTVVDAGDRPETLVVARMGEPRRDELDRLMAEGTPHLLLRSVEGRVTVGPFVVPGRTACVRCEDAHRTDQDPRWPLLLAQLPSPLTPRVTAKPLDRQLVAVASGWAARDVVTFVDGGEPATWSTTVTLDPSFTLARRRWLRHPHCGCAWGDLTASG